MARLWQLVHSGDRARARAVAERLALTAPAHAEVQSVLALLSLDEGAIAQAVDAFRRAAFLDPQSALAHFGLGRAYRTLGQRERARASLIHARRIIAPLGETEVVPGGGGLAVGDLRRAIDALLAGLGQPRRPDASDAVRSSGL